MSRDRPTLPGHLGSLGSGCYPPPVRASTIAKHEALAPGSPEARSLGRELRRLRLARGLAQQAVGSSFTRAYVSAVENGHIVPSLAGLILLSRKLGVSPGAVLDAAVTADVLADPGNPG